MDNGNYYLQKQFKSGFIDNKKYTKRRHWDSDAQDREQENF